MKLRRWLPILALAAIGAGAIACAGGEDLNPQPLPPGGGGEGDKEKTAGDDPEVPGGSSSSGYTGSSSGGGSSGAGATPNDPSDAGAELDAKSDQ